MHTNGQRLKRQMNGFKNTALATSIKALAAAAPEPKKVGPQTWSTALETCRKAMPWSIPEFIAQVFKGDVNVQPNDVRRWEAARAIPSIAQCQKIRMGLPRIVDFDEMLPLDRRALKTEPKPAHPVPVQLEGWPGPKVATFGEALRWCRMNAGQPQRDLAIMVGVRQVTVSRWENESGAVIIKDVYNKVCEIFPALDYAPKPEFSQRYNNTIRSKGYLEAEAARMDAARHSRVLDEAEEARRPTPKAPPPAPVMDYALLNQLGAAYGVAKATLRGLVAEEQKLKGRHDDEQIALVKRQEGEMQTLKNRIADAERAVREAEERVDSEASDMHRRAP